MANKTYTLVGDNQSPAEWTDVNDVTPDQKVLIGTIDEKSGNMKAEWRPSSQAAVFIEKTITENGVYDPQQENADGYSMVTVTTPTADLGTKTITANGTYAATDDNKDGFSEVTVNVPGTEFSASPATFKLISNIRNLNVQIPSGVTTIGSSAFYECTGLTSIEIPSGVTTIGSSAFQGCTGLTSIEIPSGVTTISNYAFTGCTNITSIVVHKAEGSIAGAPWGATNATVTWDGE